MKKKIGKGKPADKRKLKDLAPKDTQQVKGGPAGVNNFRIFVVTNQLTK